MNRAGILNKTIEITEEIEIRCGDLVTRADEETDAKVSLADREAELMRAIIDETNPETNKPRYSNEAARDAEFVLRSANDPAVLAQKMVVRFATGNRILLANKIDKLKSQVSLYKAFLQGSGF